MEKPTQLSSISPSFRAWAFDTNIHRSRGFLFRLGILTSGTAIAQLIGVIAAPLISRLYTPADFGVLGSYLSVLGIGTVLATLRYENAITIVSSDLQAMAGIYACLLLAFVNCILAFAILGALHAFGIDARLALQNYIWLLPLGMLLSATYNTLSLWSVRKHSFATLARTKITQALAMVATQILGGISRSGPLLLLLGQVIGQTGGITSLARAAYRNAPHLVASVTWKRIRRFLVDHSRFPKYSVLASCLEAGGAALPYIYLVVVFNSTVVGWFTLVQRYLFIPASILSISLGQVFLAEFAEVVRTSPEQRLGLFLLRLRITLGVGLALGLLAAFLVPPLIPFLFGANWINASKLVRLLAIPLGASVIATPFGAALDVLQRQDLHLIRETTRFILIGSSLALSHYFRVDWERTVLFLSMAMLAGSGFYLAMSWLAISKRSVPAIMPNATVVE